MPIDRFDDLAPETESPHRPMWWCDHCAKWRVQLTANGCKSEKCPQRDDLHGERK